MWAILSFSSFGLFLHLVFLSCSGLSFKGHLIQASDSVWAGIYHSCCFFLGGGGISFPCTHKKWGKYSQIDPLCIFGVRNSGSRVEGRSKCREDTTLRFTQLLPSISWGSMYRFISRASQLLGVVIGYIDWFSLSACSLYWLWWICLGKVVLLAVQEIMCVN